MHPIVAEQIASQLQQDRHREAAARRAVAVARPPRSWRARQARHLLALARRLDPTLEQARAPRAVAAR